MKPFICTYTNSVKDYCDEEFFKNLFALAKGNPVCIVDNTAGTEEYYHRLKEIAAKYGANPTIIHLDVSPEPRESQFQRNVANSANLCRSEFLKTDCDVMIVIESDVIPVVSLIEEFEKGYNWIKYHLTSNTDTLDGCNPLGIIGGLYYLGFHDYTLTGLQLTEHVLSGCTLYTRELLESTPFRWDIECLGAFSDFWISYDARVKNFSIWNDHRITCQHLCLPSGARMSKAL